MAAVALYTTAIGLTGLCGAGWMVNFLDLAPHYASVLLGFSNTFSTLPGIVGPYLTAILTTEVSGRSAVAQLSPGLIQHTVENWRVAFIIIGFLYAFSAVFVCFMASGAVEVWSLEKDDGPESLPSVSEGPRNT